MNALVLDTNIVSYLMRDDTRAEAYRERLQGATLAVSFMTVAELYEGAFKASWGEQKLGELEETLKTYLVVPFSDAMCRCWGSVRARRRRQPISATDAWIAATALACECPLVTHNPRHFQGIAGLEVISETKS